MDTMDEGNISAPTPTSSSSTDPAWTMVTENLPQQIVECLKLSGYTNQSSLLALNDVTELEQFLRENAELLLTVDPEAALVAFGMFVEAPDKFKLLPGHHTILLSAVNKMKEELKPERKPVSTPVFPSRAKKAAPSKDADYLGDSDDLDDSCHKIRRNLSIWISKQPGKLKELTENVHYSVLVTPLRKAVMCLACQTKCSIPSYNGYYGISNYRRHVTSNCVGLRSFLKSAGNSCGSRNTETPRQEMRRLCNDPARVRAQVLERMNTWISKQEGELGKLVEEQHYSLVVTAATKVIRCLLCDTGCVIGRSRGVDGEYTITDYTRHVTTCCPAFEPRSDSAGSPVPDDIREEENPSEDNVDVRDQIRECLRCWIEMQEGGASALEENMHYSIVINRTRRSIRCLLCQTSYTVGTTQGSYVIANYTKHLLKNCSAFEWHDPASLSATSFTTFARGARPDVDGDESDELDSSNPLDSLEDVQQKVRENLHSWIQKNKSVLPELVENEHYSLAITRIAKKIRCLRCDKACNIQMANGYYILSNFHKHVMKNCQARKWIDTESSERSATLKRKLNGVQATIIHPATDKHVDKFCSKPFHLVVESAQDYVEITMPWIQSSQFSLQWVENILNHTSEADRIVFEDSDPEVGFVLLPDLKWNRERTEELYLVAIVHRRGLHSLRDLEQEHLPLLKNIRDKGLKAIKDTYGVGAHQLRVFLHYHPSYYHLHVHFTHLRAEGAAAGASVHVERAHLLESVINVLEFCPGYYQNSSLTFAVKEGEPLWQKFKEANKFDD